MRWSNFFHIYQPPAWNADIIRRVTTEAYQPLLDILERHPKLQITLNITGSLIEQLADGGRLVIPLGSASDEHQDLRLYRRDEDNLSSISLFPVRFVPLRTG